MTVCQAYPVDGGFVRSVLDFVDCQALSLGSNGYQAMAAPGSATSLALTGLLTLFVALFGYRMLLGHIPGVRDGVLALLKVGIVLTLATNWPAYRTLAYDLTLRGPAQLAAAIGGASDIPAANGGLVARLDNADTMLATLAGLGAGGINRSTTPPLGGPAASDKPMSGSEVFTGFDTWALGWARLAFLTGTVGAFAGVRLIAALLLAVGPLFVAFLLFEGTRGLFAGWLRVLAGAALGAAFIAIILGIELALIEPWLIDLISRRYANQGIGGVPTQLLAATIIFDIVLLAVTIAAARVMAGLNLALPSAGNVFARFADTRQSPSRPALSLSQQNPSRDNHSRALAVADAVASAQRREASAGTTGRAAQIASATIAATSRETAASHRTPLGQSGRRRTATRVSAGARRRDRAS